MTFPFKLRYLQARAQELTDEEHATDNNHPTPEASDAEQAIAHELMSVENMSALQSNKYFLASQAVLSEFLQGELLRPLEVSPPIEDDDIEPVPLDEFLKARGADDCLLDSEETERQKVAHEKYVQLHEAIEKKMLSFLDVHENLLERVRCVRPLLMNERIHRVDRIKSSFNNLKRKVNHAFVDVPGSYISKRRKRGSLPKGAVRVLKKWLFDHFSHPYPSIEEKEALSAQTGLKTSQVNYWFINARVRIWKPMIATMKG
eukprot:TRINITY_DN12248_c0_g1_i1.p1 TRINITY_DN12248_c0_g1~~TRINITY_DN12248_c0_g1_i1.p1  ORF type:complete len:260 (+),score=69.25 TRINITY_DN12248_c0_g1_i1:1077-1856(+)